MQSKKPWNFKKLVFALLLFAILAIVYRMPISDIFTIAVRDQERSYIFFVPFVALYLVWLRRSRVRNIKFAPSIVGVMVILLGWLGFLLGAEYDIVVLWQLGFLFGTIGILVSFLGTGIIKPFSPAFFLIFALIPLPGSVRQELAQPLQSLATSITASVLDMVGIPAIQNGNLITINGVSVAVGEACNGMRLLVPLGIVIFAFVFSLPLRRSMRVILIIASVPVALLCNVVRLVPTAIAYGYSPGIAELTHTVGGWLMIPLSIMVLLGFLRLVKWLDIPVSRWRLVTA